MRSTKTIVLFIAFSLFVGTFAQTKKEVVCGPVNTMIACTTIGEEACATYKDGSQKDILANACTCQSSEIVKYTYGACPSTQFTPANCTKRPGVQYKCTADATPGCAGYKNGTYAYLTNTNNCIICQKDEVLSFNEGQKCPALSSPTPSNPNKVVCPATTPSILICPATGKDACATYKDGSKKNILANSCTCKNKDIVDYTFGKCALSSPNTPKQCNHADAYQCPATPSTFCPLYYIDQSCVCYKNGTCKTVQGGNSCSICGGKDVVSVAEGKTCPTTCSLSSSGDKLKAAKAKVAAALKKLQEAQAAVKKYQKEYDTAVAELNALQKNN